MDPDMHGVPLIERVIRAVTDSGDGSGDCSADLTIADPRPLSPEAIAALRMPGGKPLPPSLRRWLEFDALWLAAIGWFDDPAAPELTGMSLSAAAEYMYGSDDELAKAFADFEVLLPGACFPLVGGSDSRRLLYVGDPDSTGEYPVLVLDIDDAPYVAVMYPGLDVYLGDEAGVLDLGFGTYTGLAKTYQYGLRMREHAENTRLGRDGKEVFDLFSDDGDDWEDDEDEDGE